jgi:hypothetical protein
MIMVMVMVTYCERREMETRTGRVGVACCRAWAGRREEAGLSRYCMACFIVQLSKPQAFRDESEVMSRAFKAERS